MKFSFDTVERIPLAGCWIWMKAIFKNGYGGLNDGGVTKYAHRSAWEKVNGPIPAGLCVLHRCDVRCCVNPDHLFLGTAKDNSDDKISKGRSGHVGRPGIDHSMAKLTEQQVLSIRCDRRILKDIADEYGISISHAHRIKTKESWRTL